MYYMQTTSVRDLQHNLARILSSVSDGETVIVTRRNKQIAQIIPMPRQQVRKPLTAAQIREYWRRHKPVVKVRGTKTSLDIVSEGRGDF